MLTRNNPGELLERIPFQDARNLASGKKTAFFGGPVFATSIARRQDVLSKMLGVKHRAPTLESEGTRTQVMDLE